MFYFVFIRAWVKNLYINNFIENTMVIMPSYLSKNIKDKTWSSSVKKTTLVKSQTYKLRSTFYWRFRRIKVMNMEVCRVRPKWNLKNKN